MQGEAGLPPPSALKILEELLSRLELLEIAPRLPLPERFRREQSWRDQDTRLEDDGTVLEAGSHAREPLADSILVTCGAWQERSVFEALRIGEHGSVEWPGGLDLCGDALYLRLTGKSAGDVFPKLRLSEVDA